MSKLLISGKKLQAAMDLYQLKSFYVSFKKSQSPETSTKEDLGLFHAICLQTQGRLFKNYFSKNMICAGQPEGGPFFAFTSSESENSFTSNPNLYVIFEIFTKKYTNIFFSFTEPRRISSAEHKNMIATELILNLL